MNAPARSCSGRMLRALVLGLSCAAATPLLAQPFGAFMVSSPTNGYLEIPADPALNPADAITIEAWVSVTDPGGCSSIVGKNWTQSWWVGICGTTLRSYLKGTPSLHDGGRLDSNWNHIAVVYDGTNRYHYINGEVVGTFPETGALPASSSPMRIGSDAAFNIHPQGAIDEVRIWNVARTTDEIRSTINVPLSTATPGLVAVWSLDGSGNDALGGHNGSPTGSVPYLDFPVAPSCVSNATTLCFETRFAVSVSWTKPDGTSGIGTVVPGASSNSGLFWFFDPTNWELLVKELNGCGINGYRWVFSAATTNVHYRLSVLDITHGVSKIYFNYQGVSAPAVTDVLALATCP